MARPTLRGYALLGLAATTYLAGRTVGTWELYLFAFAFLAAVILSWLSVLLTGRKTRATRTLTPDRPVAGDEPEIVFRVKNESLLPGPELALHSQLAGMSALDLDLEVDSIGPHGERVLRGRTGRVNRGVHVLPATVGLAEDALGLAKAAHKLAEPFVVTVLPRIVHLESCALYPDIGLKQDWSGRHGLLRFGASEFRGVRPHQPGEPLSHIDWKSTAKTGNLMIREMDEPAGADVTLLLDGTSEQVAGRLPDTNFELAVRATGSIADFVLRVNRGVTLLCHERKWREVRLSADGSGRRALMQALAETQPNASAPLVSALPHLRTGGPHSVCAQSITLVSLSLDRHLVRTLLQLHEEGARLGFLYVVPASFGGQAEDRVSTLLPFLPAREDRPGMPRGDEAAAGATTTAPMAGALPTEARALLLSLSSAGIPCLTLSRSDDLLQNLSLLQQRRATGTATQ